MAVHKPSAILLGFSIFLLLIGIILLICTPLIINFILNEKLPLLNNSLSYKLWKDIPLPIYQRIYFFNITNPDDFLNKGAKPNFVEIGPYTYRSHWDKHNISWFKNDTVSYEENRIFSFNRNLSVGGEDDVVMSINGPMVVAASMLQNSDMWLKLALNGLFWAAKEKLFQKKTVKELTYAGYKDPIMLIAPLINPDFITYHGKFAWLYGKNNTDDGIFNVYTGKNSLNKLNVINSLNGKTTLGVWKKNSSCDSFKGSNGEISPPVSNDRHLIDIFQTYFCRSWPLTYTKDVKVLNIPAKRFITEASVLQNGTENPENACFNLGKDLPSGALDISGCQYGAPAVLSLPHFYLADPVYLNAVSGLSPNSSLHSFYVDVEPTTGFSCNAQVSLQINLYIHNIKLIWPFTKLSSVPLVFPVLWQKLQFYLTEELAEEFEKLVIQPQLYAKIGGYLAIGLGFLLLLSAFIVYFIFKKKKQKDVDDVAPLAFDDTDSNYGHTNNIMNGKIDHEDDEPPIRYV